MTTQHEALRLADYLHNLAAEIDHTHYTDDVYAACEELRRLHAENEALKQQIAPAGWKPVPVEPTPEMLDAANLFSIDVTTGDLRGAWKDMLAAAPAPEACEPPWMAAFDKARDAILNDRGALEGMGMTNDQTNAVLLILDDCMMPHLKRGAPAPEADKLNAASEYQRGWQDCAAAWADHMKRMNDALSKPLPEGWANHAHHIRKNVRDVLDAAQAVLNNAAEKPEAAADARAVAWQFGASFWSKLESVPAALREQATPLYTHPAAVALTDAQCDAVVKAILMAEIQWSARRQADSPQERLDSLAAAKRAAIRAALGQPVLEPMSESAMQDMMAQHFGGFEVFDAEARSAAQLMRAVERRTAERLGVKVGGQANG